MTDSTLIFLASYQTHRHSIPHSSSNRLADLLILLFSTTDEAPPEKPLSQISQRHPRTLDRQQDHQGSSPAHGCDSVQATIGLARSTFEPRGTFAFLYHISQQCSAAPPRHLLYPQYPLLTQPQPARPLVTTSRLQPVSHNGYPSGRPFHPTCYR